MCMESYFGNVLLVLVIMEALNRAGVNLEMTRENLVSSFLLSHSEDQLRVVRTQRREGCWTGPP